MLSIFLELSPSCLYNAKHASYSYIAKHAVASIIFIKLIIYRIAEVENFQGHLSMVAFMN